MRKIYLFLFCFGLAIQSVSGAAQPQEKQIMLPEIAGTHPRLFVNSKTGFLPLRETQKTVCGKALAERVVHDAEVLLKESPAERIMQGRRLLGVSRNVLYRINTLAMAYHLTRERRFAERAAREMCAVSDFSDWNPSHFLDVAEMTLALAVGYDWLYDMLDDEQRLKIRSAIIEKGIKPSFSGRHWWITGKNNWNQVCHAGMVAGALAVADSEPELAEKTILRAIRNLPRSMKASFSPNGAYLEGPTYWGYGTEFTVVLLALLEGAFGQDFGLSEIPGFSVTGDFVIASTAPTGELFNYADCGKRLGSSFAMHWLIRRFNRPDWFSKNERKALKREAERRPRTLKNSRNRLLPLSLLYLQDWTETASRNLVFYSGDTAEVPIAIYRTGWKSTDAYLGVKGGSPSGPHGHMDGGSFIYEANGVRWVSDLGAENYYRIESQGLALWDARQESDRWHIFRIGPDSHSILRVDGEPQLVKGKAEIVDFQPERCVLDLTSLYKDKAKKVIRKLELRPDRSLRVTDSLSGLKPNARICWQLCTATEASGEKTLLLRSGGKKLAVKKNRGGKWKITPAEKLMHEFDSPNPGILIVSFDAAVPADGDLELTVEFLPENRKDR